MGAVLGIFQFCFQFLQDKKFYGLCIQNAASGLLQIGHKSENLTWRHFQFFLGGGGCFVSLVKLSSLVIGLSFMWITLLVLELWQFSVIRGWPEIRKSETPLSEFSSRQISLVFQFCIAQSHRSLYWVWSMWMSHILIGICLFQFTASNQMHTCTETSYDITQKMDVYVTW